MKLPAIRGVIDRRILANFRVAPDAMAQALPAPFRPKLVNGFAIGGICLIRLKELRPRFSPLPLGLRSENAAHRMAVEWDEGGRTEEGVYIPRRDTNSRLNTIAGGTVFPGVHHLARFDVAETADRFSVSMRSRDGESSVHISGSVATGLPATSVFRNLGDASAFFERGALGYSATKTVGRYDGLELRCEGWMVEPLDVDEVRSSYFEESNNFPADAVAFDCALLMRGIDHEWHGREDLCCDPLG